MSKIYAASLILLILLLFPAPSIRAQVSSTPYLQVTLDKPYYYPGDAGKLMVDIRDTLSLNIEVLNVSVVFAWRAYINGHWDGNQTINLNKTLASGAWLPTITVSFIMPSDSRYLSPPFYYYPGGPAQVTVWASGIGAGGGTGTFSQPFFVAPAVYYAQTDVWHTIMYILIAMTVLVGVMTGGVLYYVYSGMKHRRELAAARLFRPSSDKLD